MKKIPLTNYYLLMHYFIPQEAIGVTRKCRWPLPSDATIVSCLYISIYPSTFLLANAFCLNMAHSDMSGIIPFVGVATFSCLDSSRQVWGNRFSSWEVLTCEWHLASSVHGRPFLRRPMNRGTGITGQLRQPTTSILTWPGTQRVSVFV